MTEWRVVPSLPCYEVSERGDVRRCARGIRGGEIGKVMKPYIRADGYPMFILRHENASHHRKAHQLVMEAFGPERPSDSHEIRHLDGDPKNNHASNLAWGTSAENKADMLRHGTRLAGEAHPRAKLCADDAIRIREMRRKGAKQAEIAEAFGIRQPQVCRILSGDRWATL